MIIISLVVQVLIIIAVIKLVKHFLKGKSGTTGTLKWTLEKRTLTISGNGEMPDYGYTMDHAPWYEYRDSIDKIVIHNGVTNIGNNAFEYYAGDYNTYSISIPATLTDIPIDAFKCPNLTSISVEIGNDTYVSENGVLFNKTKTILIRCPQGTRGDYVVPDSVTTIGESAFAHCKYLTSITIPNSVTSIGKKAFGGCWSLNSIKVGIENISYVLENGVLFNTDKTTLICYPCKKTEETYTIPNSVTTIGENAFEGSTNLFSVKIPNSVTTIKEWAFVNCEISSITIPESITNIGEYAFWGCERLTSIINLNPVPIAIESNVFYEKSACVLRVPANSITAYNNADVWQEFTIIEI
jgi:hypothetical protein